MNMNLSLFLQVSWMFLVPLIAVIIPVYIGERIGIHHRLSEYDIQHTPIASVVSSAFGLLAFMLAFTFQIAANRYDARKATLIEEVKNIRIAYLRAGLVPEPYRSATKKHLTKYVDLRVDLLNDLSKMDYAFSNSRSILDSLWSYTESLAVDNQGSEFYALYTSSVNDVIDAYYERATLVVVYRIPKAILSVLFIIGILSMFALGYQFGVTGKGSFGINMLLATTFATVMCLIFALDRPETGLIPVNQRPLMILHEQMHAKESKSLSDLKEN